MIGQFDQREPFMNGRHKQLLADNIRNAFSACITATKQEASDEVFNLRADALADAIAEYNIHYTDIEEVSSPLIRQALDFLTELDD